MSGSEVFFILIPLVWLIVTLFVVKDESWKKFIIRWVIMVVACFVLGSVMEYRIGKMMGGGWSLAEGLYYGWFLAGFFTVLQVVKKIVLGLIRQVISLPAMPIREVFIKILYYGILFIIMIPFFLAMTSVHRCKVGDAFDPKTTLGLDYENVSWKTSDGLKIKGWFIPAASGNAVLIAHGLGANKSNFIGTAEMWHQLGFNVLIFDLRGHGESDGHTVTFGYRERLDIIGGWDYLTQVKKFMPDKIVGYGVSFGGAALIHAANQIHGFHKIIIDSSFASLDDMATHIVEEEPIVPAFFRYAFKEIGLFFIRLDVGFDIREKSPENFIGNLAGTPILLIHGKGDPLIYWKQSQRLYDRACQPKQVIFLNAQGHFGTFNDPGYPEMIKAFLSSEKMPGVIERK